MTEFMLLTGVALGGLLALERAGNRTGAAVAKPLASLGFLGVAVAAGALESTTGTLILVALAWGLAGDVLLIPKERKATFIAGMIAFLLGHGFYIAAFARIGVDGTWAAMAAAPLAIFGAGVLRWLWPHLGRLRLPVTVYVAGLLAMFVFAIASSAPDGMPVARWLGAALFVASDVSVARNRFVHESFWNRAWGLPLYYAGQILLATTAGG